MSWVADKAGDVIEGVGDYVIDPITGEAGRERAKESQEAGTQAAGRARDIAVDYNQRALDAQLASYLEQEDIAAGTTGDVIRLLGGGYTAGQEAMTDAYGRIDPAVAAGGGALGQLAGLYGIGTPAQRDAALAAFETSPGYEFRKAEGEKALRRMASAKGNLGSGSMYKDLMRYGQGLASSEYGNYVGQLQSLASQFPTQALTTMGLNEATAARLQGAQLGDIASAYGQTRGAIEGARGDARSTAYLSEGAAKAGYETAVGNLLSQLALVPGGNVMTTATNLGSLAGSVAAIGKGFAGLPGGDPYGYVRPTYADGGQQAGPFLQSGQFN
jgi:hypothetical protein